MKIKINKTAFQYFTTINPFSGTFYVWNSNSQIFEKLQVSFLDEISILRHRLISFYAMNEREERNQIPNMLVMPVAWVGGEFSICDDYVIDVGPVY